MAIKPLKMWHKLRNVTESINSLDSPGTLSRKSREELLLLRQEFNPPGIMQARQVHIVYTFLTMRLPGETSQQEQLLHHVQEQTQISPLLQSYHLPCAPCLLSPQQAHECPNHATLLGTGSGLQLTVTSKHGCILELSLVEVSPHSHADATLCLNDQVGEHSMSTILIYLIPQEFNTVAGGLYW